MKHLICKYTPPLVGNAYGMAGIINYFETMFFRYSIDGLDVTRIAKHVHRHDGDRFVRNLFFQFGGIEI